MQQNIYGATGGATAVGAQACCQFDSHLQVRSGPSAGEGRMDRVIPAHSINGRPITTRAWLVAGALAAMLLAPSTAFAAGSVYVGDGVSGATLATFPVAAGGALSAQASAVNAGGFGFGVAVAPNGQELYTTDASSGTVSALSIAGGGTPTLQTVVASGADADSSPDGIAVAPNGQELYVANYDDGTISTFTIGPDGTLIQQGTGAPSGADSSSDPVDVVVAPNGQNLYATNLAGGTVSTFTIGAGGALTQEGTGVPSGAGGASLPRGLAITPNGQDLYVANTGLGVGTVSTFSIGAGGALTQLGTGLISGTGPSSTPWDVAVSPNGRELYVTNFGAGTVSTFSIGAGGALAQQGTGVISGANTTSQPEALAVSPNGQQLYVTNFGEGTVSTFSIGAGGTLTQQGTGALVDSDPSSQPAAVAVSPDAGPSAAFTETPAAAGSPSVFNAQASSPGSAPIASYAWQFGDGSSASGAVVDHVFATAGTYKVTLTLTATDSCSVFGPFTGKTAFCTADPAAVSSHTITIPAPPTTAPQPASTTPAPPSTTPAPPSTILPPSAPSNAFSVVSHKIAGNGTITLVVLTHAPGALGVDATFVLSTTKRAGNGRHRKARTVRRTITYAVVRTAGSGTLKMTLHPGAIARGLIHSHHTLRLTLALSFKPAGGTANTLAPLTLTVKPPARRHHR